MPQAQRTITSALPHQLFFSLKYFKGCCFISFPGTSNRRSWYQLKPAAAPTAGQGRLESVSLCDSWSLCLCHCNFQVRRVTV